MRKYGESKTTRIMMAIVPHVTSGSGLRKFKADGFLFDRVYSPYDLICALTYVIKTHLHLFNLKSVHITVILTTKVQTVGFFLIFVTPVKLFLQVS